MFSAVGGAVCLDFANTGSQRRVGPFKEELNVYDDLVDWAVQTEQLTPAQGSTLKARAAQEPTHADAVLARAHALREAIYGVFTACFYGRAVSSADLALLSQEYATAASHRALISVAGAFDFDWQDSDQLDRPLWPVAVSAANLAASDEAARVKECATENCNWIFLDASKNRSRRWCEMKECGNRAKARRHYHKRIRTSS